MKLDSFLKRLVFGYKSGQFFEIVFSDLIDEETRVHYYRTPLQRLRRVAPFLYYDSDPFAVAADDRIIWLVNGMTYTDTYPYSQIQELENEIAARKSDQRQTKSNLKIAAYQLALWAVLAVACVVGVVSLTHRDRVSDYEATPPSPVFQRHEWWDHSLMLDAIDTRRDIGETAWTSTIPT